MSLTLDPEIGVALMKLVAARGDVAPPAVGDITTRREASTLFFELVRAAIPRRLEVRTTSFSATAQDGATIALTWYEKIGAAKGPAVLYLHGGGMIMGSVEGYEPLLAHYVATTGVPFLAVEYRLAPEHPHPTPVEDCYAALVWLVEHASKLGVDPTRIGVMGDSAGGGLAAGTALLARDRKGPSLKRQILVYPMLDDRTVTPDPGIAPYAVWSYDDNVTGWSALLGPAFGSSHAHYAAVPARATDLSGVPPAYIDVGTLDIFRDEDVAYATALNRAGVDTELHVYAGVPHAFEALAPTSAITTRAMADRCRAIQAL